MELGLELLAGDARGVVGGDVAQHDDDVLGGEDLAEVLGL
jgi:hypothetical protein